MFPHCFSAVLLSVLLLGHAAGNAAEATPRERLSLDPGWRFAISDAPLESGIKFVTNSSITAAQTFGVFAKAAGVGAMADPDFDDLTWRRVDLPHDWAVELPFDEQADIAHGAKAIGPRFPANSVGWYRRPLDIPASDQGRRLWLEFDGVFRDSEVYLNGHYLGRHFSGYTPFAYDITAYINYGGPNTLAVKADSTRFEGWFYEGAGIYRHVWLVKTGPVHIPRFGTYVTSEVQGNPEAPSSALVTVRTTVRNDADQPAKPMLETRLIDAKGTVAGTAAPQTVSIEPWSETEVVQTIQVNRPALWSLENPHLYQAETVVRSGSAVQDRYVTATGIRTIQFDAAQGFLINGKHVFIKGTCNHQDHAGVGVALPDRLNAWRLEQLKAIGCNAYRTSHNPPTPELLDACDRMGILVMDETRLCGATDEALSQLETLIRRDRNHPSVVIWSLANEEFRIQGAPVGAAILAPMHRLARRLDPTRSTTAAMNGGWGKGFSDIVDVQGWNYISSAGIVNQFHQKRPTQPVIASEEASHTTTRGVYVQDDRLFYCHADETKARPAGAYANSAEKWWNQYQETPYVAGAFVWTGFDYRGEPTPYHRWPSVASHFGILDTCGFPKDIAYYYKAWWTPQPVLHLLPHWNWQGKEGQPIDVRCDGNAEEVELFLNGQSQGCKPMPRNRHLEWKLPYQPGTLSAKGYTNGRQISETAVETTGAPAAIRLTPDRATISADGQDVSVITVAAMDAKGRVVPTAGNKVSFELTGPGRILGVGNGDPICHEADALPSAAPVAVNAADWRKAVLPAAETTDEKAAALQDAAWAEGKLGPKELQKNEIGVWRGTFTLTADQLRRQKVALDTGLASGTLALYVNGTRVPCAERLFTPPAGLLKEGANTFSAVVSAGNRMGGLTAVPRVILESTNALPWSRSLFNGLAQIIVSAGRQPGEIRLNAKAEGLAPATLTVQTTAPKRAR